MQSEACKLGTPNADRVDSNDSANHIVKAFDRFARVLRPKRFGLGDHRLREKYRRHPRIHLPGVNRHLIRPSYITFGERARIIFDHV